MFLGTGKHAREDLPVLVQQLRDNHPRWPFMCNPPLAKTHA